MTWLTQTHLVLAAAAHDVCVLVPALLRPLARPAGAGLLALQHPAAAARTQHPLPAGRSRDQRGHVGRRSVGGLGGSDFSSSFSAKQQNQRLLGLQETDVVPAAPVAPGPPGSCRLLPGQLHRPQPGSPLPLPVPLWSKLGRPAAAHSRPGWFGVPVQPQPVVWSVSGTQERGPVERGPVRPDGRSQSPAGSPLRSQRDQRSRGRGRGPGLLPQPGESGPALRRWLRWSFKAVQALNRPEPGGRNGAVNASR